MRVYRVEDGEGYGMYTSPHEPGVVYYMRTPPNHPGPNDEPEREGLGAHFRATNQRWRFAFASMEQLREWIREPQWRSELRLAGFEVQVIEAPNVFCGKRQVIYDPATAQHLERLPLGD